ncbi:hypothetical protein [Halobacillus andaensis]|uniref:hypothetical protein n=1 Tax=Halobacillus andaensis TaxID=1176239 RepID=UPI003D738713
MKRQFKTLPFLFIGLIAIGITTLLFFLFNSPQHQAREVVEEFYTYEQEGDFSSSWQLLHPQMKDRFSKGHYIQDRAHVFMNHFGVTTFSYNVKDAEKLKDWKMEEDSEAIEEVFSMTVVQTFKGKYGRFDIYQSVFVAEEEGDWLIMWDYNK